MATTKMSRKSILFTKVVYVLIENEVLIKTRSQLYDLLTSSAEDKVKWEQGFSNGTIRCYDLFKEMLSKWISSANKFRTIEDLCKPLKIMNCVALAESLKNKFQNSSILVLRKDEQHQPHCSLTQINERTLDEKLPITFRKTYKKLKWPISFGCQAPTNFFGRITELIELKSSFKTTKNMQVISGLGGIGKTQLCQKFLLDMNLDGKDERISRVLLNGETSEALKDAIKKLGYELGRSFSITIDLLYAFEYIVQLILENSDRLIVVIDNVDEDYVEVFGLVHLAVKKFSNVFVVVTTRNKKILDCPGTRIELGDLERDQSRLILKASLPHLNEFEADQLCELLQDYPLALQQAVAYIKEQMCDNDGYTVEDYVKEFETKKQLVLGKQLNKLEHDYTKTTLITWVVTIEKQDSNAQNILNTLGYVEPDGVNIDFLKLVCEKFFKMEPEHFKKAIKMINRYSLATVRKYTISIHRLVQEIIRLKQIEDHQLEYPKMVFDSAFLVWKTPGICSRKANNNQTLSQISKICNFAFHKSVNFCGLSRFKTILKLIELQRIDCALSYIQIMFSNLSFDGITNESKIKFLEKCALWFAVANLNLNNSINVTNDIILSGEFDVGCVYAFENSEEYPAHLAISDKVFGKNSNLSQKIRTAISTATAILSENWKIIMLGDSGVGKSSLLQRFCDNTFQPECMPTIGVDFKVKTVQVDGSSLKLRIWDTAGQEAFRSVNVTYYRNAHAVLLVYDVSNRDTLEGITFWLNELNTNAGKENVVKMLIGNKLDIEAREVTLEDGKLLAHQHSMLFSETSAKSIESVQSAFTKLGRKIIQTQNILNSNTPPTIQLTACNGNGPNRNTTNGRECC